MALTHALRCTKPQTFRVAPLFQAQAQRSVGSAVDAGTGPDARGQDRDAAAAFANLSSSLHRGFKFDRMFSSGDPSPQETLELDQMTLMSMKTQELPQALMEKILKLLRDFGHKKDLERYGRYLRKKTRSRTSTEVPRVLPSQFLPESDKDDDGPIARLRKNPAFKDLFDHADVTSMDDSTLKRLAAANKEGWRHKLLQTFWSPEASLTYLAHRYPPTWAANFRVLYEISRRAPNFRPRSVLDYGAGPAPSLAVAAEVWPGVFERAVAVEPSDHMTQLAQYMTADLDLPAVQWQRCLYDAAENFDLIIASYVQMEVRGQESRDALIKQLWNRLHAGGMLVMIEPGTPTGFKFIHSARELFMSRVGKEFFHFVAPCPHEGMCPVALTGRDWCHFEQRVLRLPKKVYNKGSKKIVLDSEKFSFLCVRKSLGPRAMYSSEREAPTPHEKSYFWPRVMFPVIKAGQHTLIDICCAPQNFERISATKSKAHSFGYRWTRTALWGDLFRFPKRMARPEARQYIPEETRVHLDRLAKRAWKALKWEEEEPGFKEEQERDKQFYGS